MLRPFRSLLRWCIILGVVFVLTWLLFGPTGGFHHHIAFGLLPYMVWNGEDPAPGSFQIVERYEVWFDPIRFVVTLLLWLAFLICIFGVVRRSRESMPPSSQ